MRKIRTHLRTTEFSKSVCTRVPKCAAKTPIAIVQDFFAICKNRLQDVGKMRYADAEGSNIEPCPLAKKRRGGAYRRIAAGIFNIFVVRLNRLGSEHSNPPIWKAAAELFLCCPFSGFPAVCSFLAGANLFRFRRGVPLQEGMPHTVGLVAGEGIQGHRVNAVKNVHFDIRVLLP